MKDSYLQDIKASRPTNFSRLACSIIFFVIYITHGYQSLVYFALLQLTLSIGWIWLIERKFTYYKENPNLWYLPASIDLFFITASIYISGISYSPVTLGYILLTCMSSADLIRARGLFTTIGSCICYLLIVLLTKFEIIPYLNIVSNSSILITDFSVILSTLLLTISCFTANSVIYQIYFQLNEKNAQLENSFDKITVLKLRQDADYALTARLMEPFNGLSLKSRIISIDFYLKQKKSFSYSGNLMEIGGDILLADELYFNNKKFILFLNGDAMGKSLQGACGALVMGAICKSFISNAKSTNADNYITPDLWLLSSITEMHRIFQSFDGSMLASIFFGLLEEESGKLRYISTEHPDPVLFRDEKVSFLEDKNNYRKLGTLGIDKPFTETANFQLEAGDVLFIGSDGKDDIIIHSSETNQRQMNDDEFLFSKTVKATKGNLKLIAEKIHSYGEISDDLSILKIAYSPN